MYLLVSECRSVWVGSIQTSFGRTKTPRGTLSLSIVMVSLPHSSSGRMVLRYVHVMTLTMHHRDDLGVMSRSRDVVSASRLLHVSTAKHAGSSVQLHVPTRLHGFTSSRCITNRSSSSARYHNATSASLAVVRGFNSFSSRRTRSTCRRS